MIVYDGSGAAIEVLAIARSRHGRRRDPALRVLLRGGDPLARAGLAALLAEEDGFELARGAGDADAILWDLGAGSAGAPERLRDHDPDDPPVLALLDDASSAASVLAAGARGVLTRDANSARIGAALWAMAEGIVVIDDAFASAVLRRRHAEAERPVEALTRREVEVLERVAEGLSNKAIADRLGISEHTAKFHVNAILAKLGAESRTEAVVRAVRLGLIAI